MPVNPWISAARPKTLPLAISGVLLGGFIAYLNGEFSMGRLGLILVTALFLQILSNFANDYGDFVKNTDNDAGRDDRMLASGKIAPKTMLFVLVFWSIATLLLGLLLLKPLFQSGSAYWLFFALGLAAIFSAIKYTVGKFALAYNSLGDLFVFVFFGPIAVCGTHFLLTGFVQPRVWLAGVGMGMFCAAVLNVNNMRDFYTDKQAGKNTLAGKMGLNLSLYYQKFLVLFGYVLVAGAFLCAENTLVLRSNITEALLFVLASSPWVLMFTGHTSAVAELIKNTDSNRDMWNIQLRNLSLSILGFVLFFGLCCWLYVV